MTLLEKHPKWALKHKQPGAELRLMKGRYYLYAVTSKWNKEKKRAQKITGKLLGRITEDKGFIPSGSKTTASKLCLKELSVKTSGIEPLVGSLMKDALEALAFSSSKCDKSRLHSALIKDLYGCTKL